MIRRKKAERKDKPPQTRWIVCAEDDCRHTKYLVGDKPAGFEREHAERLAQHVTDRFRWSIIPVEVFAWARAGGKPMTPDEAVAAFRELPVDEEAA